MKLTRKRAIEKGLRAYWSGCAVQNCVETGVDYGIILGLQMAIDHFKNNPIYGHSKDLKPRIARRLKKLEKT